MFGILLTTLSVTCGLVGGLGIVSPFMGALGALGIGLMFNVGLVELIALVVSCYIAPLITSSVLNADGLSNSITAVGLSDEDIVVETDVERKTKRALKIGISKVAALGLALIVPAFKLPILTGWFVMVIALSLMWFSKGLSIEEFVPLLINVLIQSVIWVTGLNIIEALVPNTFPIMGIIAGTAIPTLIFGSTTPRPSKKQIEYLRANLQREHPFRYIGAAVMIAIMLMFPGYSSGALITTFTPNDAMRAIYAAVCEGFIEGWVIKLFLSGLSSAKTPLGDILLASPFYLSTSLTLTQLTGAIPLLLTSIIITIILSLLLIRLLSSLSIHSNINDYSKYFIIFTLSMQAYATLGNLSLAFLSIGFIVYFLRYLISPDSQDSASLSLLTPML